MNPEITLYTDGSAGTAGPSAAACILVDRAAGLRLKVCALFATVGGPEAELFAGILGLISAEGQGLTPPQKIRWVLDSKAVIDNARAILAGAQDESPLWLLWRELARRWELEIEWVKGHDGHRENEACDRACRWIRSRGEEFLRERGEGALGLSAKRSSSWLFFDAREIAAAIADTLVAGVRCAQLTKKVARELESINGNER